MGVSSRLQGFKYALPLIMSVVSTSLYAAGFGVFDARSLGMGGASVAAGSPDHAHFYNPALLSFEDIDENHSRNGRFIFPLMSAVYSDAGESTVDIVSDDLDERISDSISQYNIDVTNLEAAQDVLNALNEFDDAIDTLNNESIELDGFFGLSVSEPANREGGSFYFGYRGLVFGRANVTEEDQAILDNYIDAMGDVANGTPLTDIDTNLVDINGQLIDPRPSLTSDAQVSSLLIGEWGIAMSKEFPVWGIPVAFGATPKIMQVEVYREDINFSEDIPSYSENSKTHLTMNFDLGVAAQFYDNFRAGLTIRDVIPKKFESESTLEVELKPKVRMGLAYENRYITIGFDADLMKNEPISTEPESQELALGFELHPWSMIDLRLGYRHNLAEERDAIVSAGIRYQIWRFVAEAALLQSDESSGGSLQFGWAF